MTGGGVVAGETPMQAGVREAKEELGLSLRPEDMVEIHKYYADWDDGTGLILHVFGCAVDLPEGGLRPDARAVNAVKLVSFEEYYDAVMWNKDEAFGVAMKTYEAACRDAGQEG